MATTYKGNKVGSSKKEGLFAKLSDEGTDLKKLKFKDFLNDVSRAPYVEHDINTGEPVERDSWWKLYVNTSELAVQRRVEDVKRISKFIASPKGILWESERAGLETIQKELQQGQSKKIEKIRGEGGEKQGFWKSVLGTAANLGKSVLEGIGLTAATLEQTGVSGTGAHVNTYISRAYLLDGSESKFLSRILSFAGITSDNGLNGAQKIIGGSQTLGEAPVTSNRSGLDFHPDPNKLMVSEDDERLSEGSRSSEIRYGTIPTVNSRVTFTSLTSAGGAKEENYRGENIDTPLHSVPFNLKGAPAFTGSATVRREVNSRVRAADNSSLGSRYGQFVETRSIDHVSTNVAKVSESVDVQYVNKTTASWGSPMSVRDRENYITQKDGEQVVVRSGVPEDLTEYNQYSQNGSMQVVGTDYESQKPSSVRAVNVRVSGSHGNLDNNDVFGSFYHNQKDNLYVTYSLSTLEYNPTGKKVVADDLGLIPFCITTITPDHRTYLNFPAYLDSYSDDYDGEWESVKYVGRPENFYGYRGFSRKISFGFKVVAFRKEHLEPLYRELNRLVGATAPSYSPTYLFMRGTLASVTIGDLLVDQLGFIPSIKLSWNVDDPWEIRNSGNYELIRVPHVLTVGVQFTPIEKQEVREDYGAYFVFPPTGSREKPVEQETTTVVEPVPEEKEPVQKERSRLYNALPEVYTKLPIQAARDNTSVGLNGGNIKAGPSPAEILKNQANRQGSYGRSGVR